MQWLDYECFICKAEKFQRYFPGTGGATSRFEGGKSHNQFSVLGRSNKVVLWRRPYEEGELARML